MEFKIQRYQGDEEAGSNADTEQLDLFQKRIEERRLKRKSLALQTDAPEHEESGTIKKKKKKKDESTQSVETECADNDNVTDSVKKKKKKKKVKEVEDEGIGGEELLDVDVEGEKLDDEHTTKKKKKKRKSVETALPTATITSLSTTTTTTTTTTAAEEVVEGPDVDTDKENECQDEAVVVTTSIDDIVDVDKEIVAEDIADADCENTDKENNANVQQESSEDYFPILGEHAKPKKTVVKRTLPR